MGTSEQSKKPVFVVSTGRAGSTMLARVLAIHPGIFALHEPHPHLRTEAFAKWSRPERKRLIERKIHRKRKDIIQQVLINRLVYVESSNYASNLIEELYELFDARFIHLYRNGRDFVRSGLQRDWYRKESVASHIKSWIRRKYLVNIGKTALDNLLSHPDTLKTRLEKISWLWVEINKTILRNFSALPDDRKFSLALESIDSNRLIELHKFIDVDIDAGILDEMLTIAGSKPNKTRKFSIPEHTGWSDRQKERFNEIAGEMMHKLGYSITDNE